MGDSWLETDGRRTDGGVVAQTRVERDPLGELPVPAEALWGIQTERARQNFPISNLRPLPAFVDAVVQHDRDAAKSEALKWRLRVQATWWKCTARRRHDHVTVVRAQLYAVGT